MESQLKIRRVLLVAEEEPAAQALGEAAAAFGMEMRRIADAARLEDALQDFGPDAVILDPAVVVRTTAAALHAISGAGSVLLVLGGPDDREFRALRAVAAAEGVNISGVLRKPVHPEGLEVALRAMVGDLQLSAAEIAGAVMRGEMTAWYQLQLERSGSGWRAGGAEALARWNHPEHGVVMPGAFVPVAQAEGQIAAITDCVLQTAVQQLGVWQRLGLPLRVAVNLSPSVVTDPDFPERLARLVGEYDLPPRLLALEIPEPGLSTAPGGFIAMLSRLRVLGFGLVLEHFGRGVSSVAELYRTPFSELKLDRRLVGLVDEDEDARRLVRGIASLARELGLDVSAEAVETRTAMDFLHEAGCARVQGFVVSRALPANAFQVVAAQWL
jgi:EAL domain-containing protein (putative c-di-GMP-specific phosphodiesterase class I)